MPGRLRNNLAEVNYATLLLEIVVVILGILIAFQIDRWTERKRDSNQEYGYLQRLLDDVRFEIDNMERATRTAESRIRAVRYLESVATNPAFAADEPATLLTALEKVSWYSFPKINGFVYDELKSTGSLSLIRSEPLRKVLAEYYTSIRGYERIALERDLHRQYDLAVAGLLSTDELIFVEYETWPDGVNGVPLERTIEIAQQFAERRGALDLLPGIAQYNVFTIKAISQNLETAKQAATMIDGLIEDFETAAVSR